MKENFPNLAKEIDTQVQEAQKILNKLDPKRTTPRHIIIKMSKVKDKKRLLLTFPFHHLEACGACQEQDFYNNKYVWKAVVQGHFCWL